MTASVRSSHRLNGAVERVGPHRFVARKSVAHREVSR